jgi:predicted nucleic acid-binding protein
MAVARAAAFVDSSAWIAFFRARDGHHREAEAMFRQAIDEKIALLTTNLVLAEVHRFVLHRTGIRPAALALDRITTSRHVTVRFAEAKHDREARGWIARFADQRLTYTDAVSFAVMTDAGIRRALTFDRDFAVAGFESWH